MALRKGQKELVEEYRGGYVAVPAIPGGGKTHSLSMWAVEMISRGLHKPGKILIVTYMNSAVNNFKQRIANELLKRGILSNKDYFVSTIHGLCLQIIKEKPDSLLVNEDFDIIDEITKTHFIESAVNEWKKKNEDVFKFFLDEVNLKGNKSGIYKSWEEKFSGVMLTAIGDIKLRGMTPAQAKEKCKILNNNSILKCAADIYEIYDLKLKKSGFMDFNDMLYNAKKLLSEDTNLLEKYRKKYSFVCEDEAQDSNLIQSEILTLIANGNLLRVGDSNQAICGSFTSSDFKYFKNFCELPKTTVYNITQSSRSTKDIIDLANFFVAYINERHPVQECRNSLLPQYIEPVAANDEYPNPVTTKYEIKAEIYKTLEEEIKNTVNEVIGLLNKNSKKTIAILVPSYWKIKELVEILELRNVSFEQLDSTAGERNRAIRTLGRVIDYISAPEDGKKLFDMLNECFLLDSYDDIKLEADKNSDSYKIKQKDLLKAFILKNRLEKILYPINSELSLKEVPNDLIKSKIWFDFTEKLRLIRELLEFPTLVIEELVIFISEILEFDKEERAIAYKIASDTRYLRAQNFNFGLKELAIELLEQRNMFSYFAGVIWELKGYEPKPGVVTIATYHKAKGLEWDTVFLTSINHSDFPVLLEDKFIGEYWFLKQEYKNPQAIIRAEMELIQNEESAMDSILKSKLETISEKARLLYVGITRAKESLILSGFSPNQGKKNEAQPSNYLVEIKKFIEGVDKCDDKITG